MEDGWRISPRAARSTLSSFAQVALAGCAVAGTGCGPMGPLSVGIGVGPSTPDFVQEIPTSTPLPLEDDAAVVIFVRPLSAADEIMPTILDGTGRFLGIILASSYFAVIVPPGDHLFVACAGSGAPLRARLAPGRRYYVEVSAGRSSFGRRLEMLPIRPSSEGWGKLTSWYVEKKRLVSDAEAGQAYVNEDARPCMDSAREALEEYDARALEVHTLQVDDGQ